MEFKYSNIVKIFIIFLVSQVRSQHSNVNSDETLIAGNCLVNLTCLSEGWI